MPKSVFVIIPCYNEGAVIRRTCSVLLDHDYSVVLVDDASTQDILNAVAGLDLFYVRHGINLGQGASLQTGIDFALGKGASYLVTFDGDGQHDAKDIEGMITLLEKDKADIVFGSRFLPGANSNISGGRKLMLRAGRYINYFFTGLLLSDAHNGFRALNRKAATLIRLRENRMTHASEFLLEVKKHGLRYTEHPVHILYTEYSKKKGQSVFNSVRILFDLILKKIFE